MNTSKSRVYPSILVISGTCEANKAYYTRVRGWTRDGIWPAVNMRACESSRAMCNYAPDRPHQKRPAIQQETCYTEKRDLLYRKRDLLCKKRDLLYQMTRTWQDEREGKDSGRPQARRQCLLGRDGGGCNAPGGGVCHVGDRLPRQCL